MKISLKEKLLFHKQLKKKENFFNTIVHIITNDSTISTMAEGKDLFVNVRLILNNLKEGKTLEEAFEGEIKYSEEFKNLMTTIVNDETRFSNILLTIDNVINGLDLENKPAESFRKYFTTDMYFSLYNHFIITSKIVSLLEKDSKFPAVTKMLNDLTTIADDSTGLFKDGIWYNYVSYIESEGMPKSQKNEGMYISNRNSDSVYIDVNIAPPVVNLRIDQNALKAASDLTKETKEIVKIDPSITDESIIELLSGNLENAETWIGKTVNVEQANIISSRIFEYNGEYFVLIEEDSKIISLENITNVIKDKLDNGDLELLNGRGYKDNTLLTWFMNNGIVDSIELEGDFTKYEVDEIITTNNSEISVIDTIEQDKKAWKNRINLKKFWKQRWFDRWRKWNYWRYHK